MLTLSQRKTLEFIKRYIRERDYSPTVAEVAEGIGIKSRGVVHRYLKALVSAGEIRLAPKRHRNIRLVSDAAPNLGSIPLMGSIAAGQPIEAIAQSDSINLASIFLGDDRYALRVKGDSMIDEGIFDGDIVVCERSDYANDGQIVVALVDQQEATLKRLKRTDDQQILLIPSNPKHETMKFSPERVEVQGIYIGLLRLSA